MLCRSRAAAVALVFAAYVALNSLAHVIHPTAFIWFDEDREQDHWVASSPSWLDRTACRYLALCGIENYRYIHAADIARARQRQQQKQQKQHQPSQLSISAADPDLDSAGSTTDTLLAWADSLVDSAHTTADIPPYVYDYAPLVHLAADELYWPTDPAEHLRHITPRFNYTRVHSRWRQPSLANLHKLNAWDRARWMFLTSNDDVVERPSWLGGDANIPVPVVDSKGYGKDRMDDNEITENDGGNDGGRVPGNNGPDKNKLLVRHTPGRSAAPAVLIVVDKGNGTIDAFWFYFYSFNRGNAVFNVRFGNHIGDWEHSLVRFHHGRPTAVYLSAHSSGEAYAYHALEKRGHRPVVYSATGTHAMYPRPGRQAYLLPFGLLHDSTSRGPLWDPVLNVRPYVYHVGADRLVPSFTIPEPSSPSMSRSSSSPSKRSRSSASLTRPLLSSFSPSPSVSPSSLASWSGATGATGWFYFAGHWGDKFYPLGDRRQYRFGGQYHFVNGPLGPRWKHLGRPYVCPGADDDLQRQCLVRDVVGGLVDEEVDKEFDGDGDGERRRWHSRGGRFEGIESDELR